MTRSYISIRAQPGRRRELLQVLDRVEVLTAARNQPGFFAAEIQVRANDEDEQLLVWSSWASPEHHDRWLAGSECQRMLREIGDLAVEPPDVRVYRVVDAVQA
jgi:quinol monooxygenase YgiN